jgi:hypothetical protein
MGCTPTAIKDKNAIPISNVKPTNKLIQTSLDKIVVASRLTARDLD